MDFALKSSERRFQDEKNKKAQSKETRRHGFDFKRRHSLLLTRIRVQ